MVSRNFSFLGSVRFQTVREELLAEATRLLRVKT
jgi:hypothetical protein